MADDAMGEGLDVESAGSFKPKGSDRSPQEQAEQDILQEIREHFALARSIESEQRRHEDEELSFEQDPWTVERRKEREHPGSDPVTGQLIPPRPALNINLLDQPIQQILNEARQAKLAVNVKPKAGLTTTKQARVMQGLLRSIQAESGALSVRLWAHERSVKVGRGAYRVRTEYANDGDFDLDIRLERILDQSTVYWDPYAQAADKRDAQWCLVTTTVSEAERKRLWPTHDLLPPEAGWLEDDMAAWYLTAVEGEATAYTIGEYWRVVYRARELLYTPARGPTFLDQVPQAERERLKAEMAADPQFRVRTVDVPSIRTYVVDATQILETHEWMGRFIPIIATIGKETLVKGKRGAKGMIRDAMDASRGYCVALSSAVQLAGSAPTAPYIMAAGQDEGFEAMWDDSPIKNYTRLYYNPTAVDGKLAPPPQRQQTEPAIQAVMFLARSLKEDVNIQMGSVSAIVRAVNPNERSGKAIEALQRQGAAGTSGYLDNLATISMPYEGMVLLDLIPKVYDRAGRILAVMTDDADEETAIMLKTPFVKSEDGMPVPVPCPTCGGQRQVTQFVREPTWNPIPVPRRVSCPDCEGRGTATVETMPEEYEGKAVEYVDLSDGTFKIAVAVGRGYQTKQEETLDALMQLAQATPELVPFYIDLLIKSMGFPGSNEIVERLQATLPQLQKADEGDAKIPPQVAQQIQALQQEHEAALAELQKATEALKTDQVKMAGQAQIQAMKAEAAAGLESLKQQGKAAEAMLKADTTTGVAQLKATVDRWIAESEQKHEVLLELLKQKGDVRLERLDQQGEAAAAERAAQVGAAREARVAAREDVRADRDQETEP